MKTKESIEIKWGKKIEEMRRKADFKYNVLLQNKKRLYERNFDYEVEKNERKKQSYIKRKEDEYRRKMLNEIREME